jgi:hypothetical protein
MLATDSTGVSVAVSGSVVDAAALTTLVDCWSADDELADPERIGGGLPAAFGAVCESCCGASGVAPSCVTSDTAGSSVSDVTAGFSSDAAAVDCSSGDARAGFSSGAAAVDCSSGDVAVGFSSGDAAATAEGTAVRVGVASAEAVVSLLAEVEAVCAPPELCTTPERGSAVELVWESPELCAASDVEPDEEPSAETDEAVDDVASDDEAFAADSDDELDVDDESDDAPAELVSSGAANATAGVFATAAPRPSTNARTPARMMCCASAGKAPRG